MRLTIPMLLGIVSLMLLGVVDMYFIGLLGTRELAGASFALPVAQIVISTALGIGMALGAIASRMVGQGNHARVARFITHSQLFGLLVALSIMVAGLFSIDPLFAMLGATREVMPLIHSYMGVWYFASPMLMLTLIGNNALRAIGDVKSSAIISAVMAFTNAILDPLLIFGYGPFPALGISGAAWATLIACTVSWLGSLALLGLRERLLDFKIPKAKHLLLNWWELSAIAVPSIGANIMTPLAAAILTAMIATFGAEAVAAFGVGSRIESVTLIVVYALSSTLPMFIGQNLGAGKPDRAYRALMGCLRFSLLFQSAIYLIMALSSTYLAGLFSDDPQVVRVIKLFLLTIPLTYGAHGVVILVMVSLNVLKRPRTALLTTIIRLLLLYIPLAYLGSRLGGIMGLFVGAGCGNIIAGMVAYRIIKGVCREEDVRESPVAV